ncbi:MAG TPA: penicillin-binding protein activator [Aggregatilineales bacterium]|nr:penicillin-binding protein activator [Aggregatilineales bacterium]
MKLRIQFVLGLLVIAAVLMFQTSRTAANLEIQSAPVRDGSALQATQAAGAEVYTLGVVLPFTGDLGEYGKGFNEGIQLAVEQMNAQLAAAGRNLSFKVVSQDTGGTPDGAAKALQTVVQTSGAQVVVGPLSTSEVLGAKQFADQNKIVIIAPASTSVAGSIPDDFIFRVFDPPDSFAGQAFQGIAAARGYKNIVMLYVDDPFGTGLLKIFGDRFKASGGGEVSAVKYPSNAADLSSEMTKVSSEVARLSASGSTAFFCACFLGDAQKALKLAVVDPNMGKVDWLGVENLYQKSMLADKDQAALLAATHFTVVSTASITNPNTQPFIDAYKAKFNKEPGPFTNFAYDAANIAMLSMLMAGNNGAAVQKIVPFVADHYIGTQVQSYLDANGDQAIAYYTIYRVKADGSDFEEIGKYDGSTGTVTFTTK